MKSLLMFSRPVRWLLALCLGLTLTACASVGGPKLVNHAFNFDGWNDGWAKSVDLLEFAYGDQYPPVRAKSTNGKSVGNSWGVNGAMPVGEFLKLKWRLKASGEVVERQVDLRDRLPDDMANHELTFVIDGQQLFVYIVTPRAQSASVKQRTHRTWLSKYNVAYEIFPTREVAPKGN
ncbi:hypothetical protein [Hydrogenophaga sp. PAMC20947]|uniref:hypothetical protein n=1 Tax=Hydrogenophaga sp. PAMC20947 TaxID=2565558 RepID=UPI00109DDA78|nr:hypothetical protein [Hydrogenophaga sp. PAMC20947]QCB47681.1 hypothetical protein E5678_17585 [Hydrogenophaga sp. PAMC20947]